MKDLVKLAEEQIDTLRDIQTSGLTNEDVLIKSSVEIRNWCLFIKSLDINKTTQEGQVQEQFAVLDKIAHELATHVATRGTLSK